VKGRNDCWKSQDKRQCVADGYRHRTAELQARYRLLAGKGPFTYACDGNDSKQVVMTFFDTTPPTVDAEFGDSTSLMFMQPSASGSFYQGRNETYREHQGEALIIWGFEAPEMHCKKLQ
jgi:hypothetical protein